MCKSCTQFVQEEQFSFLKLKPPELSHGTYCETCYSKHVVPALEAYESQMQAAREIIVYEKDQSKETRLIKRDQDLIFVKDCPDRNEAILRLAFQCVELGCNALIDVDLKAIKVRNEAHHTHMWSGSGRPAHFRKELEIKDKSFRSNPN